MKGLFIFLIISLNWLSTFGQSQSLNYPYSPDIVEFNIITQRIEKDKQYPFDKPVILKITNLPKNVKPDTAVIYQVTYRNGQRSLKFDQGGNSLADLKITPFFIPEEKNTINLSMPGIKPNRDFDIELRSPVSDEHIKQIERLFHELYNGGTVDTTSIQVRDTYSAFRRSINHTPYENRILINDSIGSFFINYFTKLDSLFHIFVVPASTNTCEELNQDELKLLAEGLCDECITMISMSSLKALGISAKHQELLHGLIALYPEDNNELHPWQYIERLSNFSATVAYLDTLLIAANELAAKSPLMYTNLRNKIFRMDSCVKSNRNNIKSLLENIKQFFWTKNVFERLFVVGNSLSKDLQTKGASIFTLDVGTSLIVTRDIDNSIAYIPKLYWGVNIYFRPVDKNIKLKYLPRHIGHQNNPDSNIVAERSIFHRLCLTVGLTINPIDKTNFDDFYNKSSLLIGPSYRIGRAFRVSALLALLKRAPVNPTLTEKKVVAGFYGSVSIDFDILQTLSKVTGNLFK